MFSVLLLLMFLSGCLLFSASAHMCTADLVTLLPVLQLRFPSQRCRGVLVHSSGPRFATTWRLADARIALWQVCY